MRKTILLASAAALAIGFASSSAFADVNLLVNVDKDKFISISETVSVTKDIDIIVDVNVLASKGAEAGSIVNQTNGGNLACENCAEKFDHINASINGNNGVTSVNQASGNNNNQGNVLTAAVDASEPGEDPPPPPPPGGGGGEPVAGGFAHAQGHVDQKNGTAFLSGDGTANRVDSAEILFRDALIAASVNDNNGLTMVNQATGQMGNQANAVTIAISLAAGGVALTESDLGQETTGNTSSETNVFKTTTIDGSINGNNGVTLVNQSAGNMGNQANNLSLGAAVFVSDL